MADQTRCSCGLRAYFLTTDTGTHVELSVKPDPSGCWAIVDGRPVIAVRFERVEGKASRVAGRLPGFEKATLYGGHYIEHAMASAARVDTRPKTGTG